MKAIIETGGKQYLVEENSILYVEKLDGNANEEVVFDKVLMIDNEVGNPYISNAKVNGKIVKHGKQKKITIFKYVQRKKYS
jgi:large subunit ribosomal protein L21